MNSCYSTRVVECPKEAKAHSDATPCARCRAARFVRALGPTDHFTFAFNRGALGDAGCEETCAAEEESWPAEAGKSPTDCTPAEVRNVSEERFAAQGAHWDMHKLLWIFHHMEKTITRNFSEMAVRSGQSVTETT